MLKYRKAREEDILLPRLFSLVGECGEKENGGIYGLQMGYKMPKNTDKSMVIVTLLRE